jgi:hypothetical protein
MFTMVTPERPGSMWCQAGIWRPSESGPASRAIGDQLGASVFSIHGAGLLFMRIDRSLGTACRIADAFHRSAEFHSL